MAAELGEATQDKSSSFSSSFADIDGDGDLDLYVSGPTLELNDVNLAFRNDGGRFVAVTDLAIDNGKNNPAAALWGDVDNDGDVDLFVANSDVMRSSKMQPAPIEHSMLYRNDRNWNFTATKKQAFATPAHPAISAALGDIDNDGDLDLFLGSHVYQVDPRPDWLFINDPVTGDIDGDGRIDALLGSWGETTEGDYITIMRNRTPQCGSWVELVVKDRAGAPNPPGTRITLTTEAGARTLQQMRESNAQTGFRSQSASAFLFAIPPGHRVRDAEVRWPDGRVQRVKRIEPGGRTTLSQS